MLVFTEDIRFLQKGDVKSDVGQTWQGLAGRGKSGSSRSFAITSPHQLLLRNVGVDAHDDLLAVHHAICFLVAVG